MTSVDKLSKAYEFLRIPVQSYDAEQSLNVIFDNITATNVRQAEEYSRMLSLATETFLVYLDDDDQDVYFVAEECLNKTIKTLIDTNLNRFPADLYRFIKKNGPERSLRCALTRFAELIHYIKPNKSRIYVEFILKENILNKLANRSEESIQNVLANCMTKICSAFCWSMTDNEINILIQSFLPNLSNNSSVNSYRRVSANCLSIICLYSRSPLSSYFYLHNELLKLILPLEESDLNKFTIWGVLLCFRYMIMHLSELDKSSSYSSDISNIPIKQLFSPSSTQSPTTSAATPTKASKFQIHSTSSSKKQQNTQYFNLINLCQIYEICMYYLNNDDNRIVIASLECLQVLIKLVPLKFSLYLTRMCSISANCSVVSFLSINHPNTADAQQQHQQNLMTSSMLSLSLSNKLSNSLDSLTTLKPSATQYSLVQESGDLKHPLQQTPVTADNRSETGRSINDENVVNGGVYRPVKTPSKSIGTFYDSNREPIVYLVRYLAYKYLLNANYTAAQPAGERLKSDAEVKVLVKAVALDCCSSCISLCPHLVFKTLFTSSELKSNAQLARLYIYDLINYINHSDDKMRTTTCVLVGQFINTVLIEYNGNYDSWLVDMTNKYMPQVSPPQPPSDASNVNEQKTLPSSTSCRLQIEILVDYLMRFIRLENPKLTNNLCKRFAVSALHSFVPTLVRTKYSTFALDIIINILHLKHSTYNLVKCELVDLLASIDFKAINYTEQVLPSDTSRSKHLNKHRRKASQTIHDDEDDDEEEEDEEEEEEDDDDDDDYDEEPTDADDDETIDNENNSNPYKVRSVRRVNVSPFMVRKTQERIVEDVFLYLLGSDDSKLRLETARSLTRFVLNANFYELCSNPNQNLLLSAAESFLKSDGHAANLFNASVIDNDLYNLHTINTIFENNRATGSSSSQPQSQPQTQQQQQHQQSTSFKTPTSLLHSIGNKRQIKYLCSPLSSLSLQSSIPSFSKVNQIVNNNFIQPFYSLIKHWPSNVSNTNIINNSLNKLVEQNLSYIIPVLVNNFVHSIDKNQFIGCLEAIDFLFQTFEPAIFYSSPVSAVNTLNSISLLSADVSNSNSNYQQIYDLLAMLVAYLKHPTVAFDFYVHDIVLRLVGHLLCSYTWLWMKKLDKMVDHLNIFVNNTQQQPQQLPHKFDSQPIQQIFDFLNNSLRVASFSNSQAEQVTGINYTYSFAFNNTQTKSATDAIFVHSMRMLCVLACVIDESALPSVLTSNLSAGSMAAQSANTVSSSAPSLSSGSASNLSATNLPTSNASNPNLPTSAANSSSSSSSTIQPPSFIRSKLNSITEINRSSKNTPPATDASSSNQAGQQGSQRANNDEPPLTGLPKSTTSVYLGYFQNSSHYLKLYETAKVAYNIYKKSPSMGTYDRFTNLVKTTLHLFAQLLEAVLSVHEIGPHLDEMLLYLKIIFNVDASCSVKCVTLCLKSLFGLNLAGLMNEYLQQQLNRLAPFVSQSQSQSTANSNNNSSANLTTLNNNQSMSGLSSVMSGSLTSLTSLGQHFLQQQQQQQQPFSQLTSSWSSNSRRHQTSLYSTLITNSLTQFTRFMYSQTIWFKNESLVGIQFNPNTNMGLMGLDSIEYLSSSGVSSSAVSASQSLSNVQPQPSRPQPAQNTNSHKAVVKSSPFGAGFNLFGLMRKKAEPGNNGPLSSSTTANDQLQQQQQQLAKEQQNQQKTKQQKDLKTIGEYIKSFESIVIRSLRQYTLTTSVNLQTRILELLAQLIFLKVDYCLLDSDKVFINYVLKQFEQLEQKRPSETSMRGKANADEEHVGDLLARAYSVDVSENFDSETLIADPLNPFDLDTMLNKLHANVNSPMSACLGAGGSSSGAAYRVSAASTGVALTGTPLVSSLYFKQQEHQRLHTIIPKLFDFLIILSHEKKSQPNPASTVTTSGRPELVRPVSLITIPEIIQLCDNLIASENSPHTHAIPALRPLVLDLFVHRSSSNDDARDLEMQHEVIVNTMLRLVNYPQIWPLLSLVLAKYKLDNEDRWKKCSRQICDALFDSMRSSNANSRLKFSEFNGGELRAIRRYSRGYVPHVESLKQLFLLFNWLAPQVFRPIDFIILSLFETCRPFFGGQLTSTEINNLMCVLIVHVYLLLTNATEDQLLRRLHHLCPQIIELCEGQVFVRPRRYSDVRSVYPLNQHLHHHNHHNQRQNPNSKQTFDADSVKSDDQYPRSSQTSEQYDTESNTTTSTTSSSDRRDTAESSFSMLNMDANMDDDNELNLNEAALFLSRFLLRLLEISFTHVDKLSKFNYTSAFSSVNLTSSCASSFMRDFQTNLFRDLHYTHHLLINKLIFLIYILNSGNYPKLAQAFTTLIDHKSAAHSQPDDEPTPSSPPPPPTSLFNEDFNFNPATFIIKLNKIILFKISKTNPLLACLWQQFLVLCNHQDPEYWLLSLESNLKVLKKHNHPHHRHHNQPDSPCSSTNQSLNNENLNESSNPTNITSAKMLRSKIRSSSNYKSSLSCSSTTTRLMDDLAGEQLLLPLRHTKHKTLNEQFFKYLSMTIYCDNIVTRNQLDNTIGLTMVIINNLVELFELASNESVVLDLFGLVHRNAYASSLFIHSISSNWSNILSKKKLYLLHSCLRSLEGLHLASSGHLLNLLIEKYFNLPYLSLVRYADHIACQRVEMIQSLSFDELSNQFTEQHLKLLDKFFNQQFKYSYRHQRLIFLLDQLKKLIDDFNHAMVLGDAGAAAAAADQTPNKPDGIAEVTTPSTPVSPLFYNPLPNMKASPSIDFFMLYLNTSSSSLANLDKEWYYNIVSSSCSHSTPSQSLMSNTNEFIISDSSSLKSKQCALMLSNLDFSNISSILASRNFKLSILKECLLLGAHKTQLDIQKLPAALKQAAASTNLSLQNDFMHPLWLASNKHLFDLLRELSGKLPEPPLITIDLTQNPAPGSFHPHHHHHHHQNKSRFMSTNPTTSESLLNIYEAKLSELNAQFDFYSYFSPITESVNAYLKCIRQYPSLQNQLFNQLDNVNNLITYILFQIGYVNYISINKYNLLSIHSLNQSFLAVFNLLVDQQLLDELVQRPNYSTLISHLIKDFYQLIIYYFYKLGDEHTLNTPLLSSKFNIDYKSNSQNLTNDVVFNTITFETLLKLRFIVTSPSGDSSPHGTGAGVESSPDQMNESSLKSTYSVSSSSHRFLQYQSHFFRNKIPFHMRDLIVKIYIGLCRLPVIDRFIRIPDPMWRTAGFKLDYKQFLKNDTSTLPPLEYLKDSHILKEHLKHILLVGWTTRSQFEFEYVNMLTLLHNLSDDYYLPMSTNRSPSGSTVLNASSQGLGNFEPDVSFTINNQLVTSLPSEEIKERNKCICLVIRGLSSWLVKSTLTPKSGNSLNSLYEQVSRNKLPGFLHTQLGKQYCQIKRTIESFNRYNLFTQLNSISISSNSNLLYMLDPTLIDEIDKNRKKVAQAANIDLPMRPLDFTQPQPTADAISNLFKISMNLSQCNRHNLLFATNLERNMINNLPNETNSYFYYTQLSLEGILKILGQWNNNSINFENEKRRNLNALSIAESISNLVTSNSNVVDEVSNKTANAISTIIKVAEYLTDETAGTSMSRSESIDATATIDSLGNRSTNNLLDTSTSSYSSNTVINVQRAFNRNNLDMTSVLRTVLDYYESFFKNPCWQLKLEIVRCMLYLANSLFESKQQYESLIHKLHSNFDWLNSFIQQDSDFSLMPVVNDLVDDSVLGLAIYAECLCRSSLQASKSDANNANSSILSSLSLMSGKDFERLNKLFENGLKSNSLAIKISTLHGLLYWLESITLGYIGNPNDAKQLTDHLCKQIVQMNNDYSIYLMSNSRYISTLWSAVFYAIENCLDSIKDAQNFVGIFIKLTYSILNDANTPFFLFYQLYMGLERFLLSSMVPSFEINTIQRLFSSKFQDEQRSLCLISLTVTSLYASNQTKQINYWNDIVKNFNHSNMSTSNSFNNFNSSSGLNSSTNSLVNSPVTPVNPITSDHAASRQTGRAVDRSTSQSQLADKSLNMSGYPQILELTAYPELQAHLLKVLEIATNFLDRIKTSLTSREASIYASLLPKLLCDFLPPHDLLNKLITEFLNSSQHPYPEAVAYVLYKCFDILQEKGLQSQIQEWCLLSLSNFLQRSSIYESIWLTSCLLVSATQNQWLKSTFPFLLNRYCAFQTIDRAIFYMSVIEFRKQFTDKSQIQTIHSTFESVAKPKTPYEELIKLLNSQQTES